ncbi:MAG: cytochrome c [Acidobacteriota bacterium]|nr:cytochrome c [Acidobacteriota bacterium]
MRRRLPATAFSVLVPVLVFGWVQGLALRPPGVPERGPGPAGALEKADADRRADTYGARPDVVAAGRKLFLRHCSSCHGEDAAGTRRAPPLASEKVSRATAGDLFWFLTNGNLRTGMPSWSRLPAARRRQIVAYLQTLAVPPIRPAPPSSPGKTPGGPGSRSAPGRGK